MDIEKALRLRRDGKTYQEIADIMGCSKQMVWTVANARKGQGSLYDTIPYKGLYEYFAEHGRMTIPMFCSKCFGTRSHAMCEKFRRLMRGVDVSFTISQVEKLVKFTGKSWEELFEPRN